MTENGFTRRFCYKASILIFYVNSVHYSFTRVIRDQKLYSFAAIQIIQIIYVY